MKKEIEKSQIHKTLVVIHLSAGWHHVQVCHYWILLPPLGDSSQISWLSMAEIEAFMFFISWWKITLNTFRLCFVFAPIDTQRITSDRSVVYWFWSNWVSLWVLLHTRPFNTRLGTSPSLYQWTAEANEGSLLITSFYCCHWLFCTEKNVLMKPLKSCS